ncbi:hypothetical protein C8R47DRAFT_1248803 [Mycena vitilis]|nr:hypothetical protein C8R47DRAFT_1248789 [Mycena vitilis]KAJ6456551.1 hypothetical protein C8R47DRAFT_1248803 [Mycena vitilis]
MGGLKESRKITVQHWIRVTSSGIETRGVKLKIKRRETLSTVSDLASELNLRRSCDLEELSRNRSQSGHLPWLTESLTESRASGGGGSESRSSSCHTDVIIYGVGDSRGCALWREEVSLSWTSVGFSPFPLCSSGQDDEVLVAAGSLLSSKYRFWPMKGRKEQPATSASRRRGGYTAHQPDLKDSDVMASISDVGRVRHDPPLRAGSGEDGLSGGNPETAF